MKDMTKGTPWKVIMAFAVPLILSGIIQQFYNLADSVIVGNFAGGSGLMTGEEALAAVGASSTITMLFVGLGGGGSMGCSVVISQLFGAKRMGDLKTSVFTSLIFFTLFALTLAIVGSVIAAPVAVALNTPVNILDPATDYLRIYMFGLPFLFIYNVCNAIFNALGDSKKPLMFLIFSTLFNVLLDYIFVAKFHWEVKGVAWATFIAQGSACLMSLAVLLKKTAAIDANGEKVRAFDGGKLKSILRIGVPSMLQMSIVSIGALLVQAIINGFGSAFIAGYSAAHKIHNFMATSINTCGQAISTYTAQNIGADRLDRVNEGIRSVLAVMLSVSLVMVAVVYLFGQDLVGMFVDAPTAEVLEAGVFYLRVIVVGMIPFCFFNCFNGVARGAGYMPAFTISTLSDLVVRVAFAYAFVGLLGRSVVAISIVVGWGVGIVISCAFHFSGRWKKAKRI